MISPIANAMRLQALRSAGLKTSSRIGIVTGYDPNTYSAKVTLQPDGIDTGFIPMLAILVGNGWGMFAPPTPGVQVSVVFIDGDLNAGYIEGSFFNSQNLPVNVPAGEFLLQHATGSLLHFSNDGSVSLKADTGMAMQAGGIEITSDVGISGGLTVGTGASGVITTPTGQTVTIQDGIVTNIF